MQVEKHIANEWLKDEKSFEKLFKMNYEPLCRHAFGMLNDAAEAEEAVQQVFITLWEKRHDLGSITSIKSYLYRSVHNHALNKLKHLKVRLKYAQELEIQSTSTVDPPALRGELQSVIHKAIDSLPEQCRIIFKMSRFEELKYAEIADRLGISVKTVENQMGKALKILRELLQDYLVLTLFICQPLLLL